MSRSRIISGAKVVLYVNGKPYAQVTHFRWDSQTPKRPIYGLDSSTPYELAPGTARITGSLGLLRLVGDGGAEGAGTVPQFEDLPREKYFTLTLIERSTDTQLFRADNCSVVSQNWDVPTRGFMTGGLSFEALDWNNEAVRR